MNRSQKREFVKRAKAKGIPEEYINSYIAMLDNNNKIVSTIKEGDKVFLNVEKITSRKNYNKMNAEYRKFVEESEGRLFTAHVENEGCLISTQENPKWLFWIGDIIV